MSEPASAGARFRSIARRIDGLRERWYSSLSLRVIISIVAAGVLGIVIMGIAISTQVRASIFDAAVETDIEQFSTEVQLSQDRFAASSPSVGRTQEVANMLVSSTYDPARGVLGAVLMRSPDQPAMATQILNRQPHQQPAFVRWSVRSCAKSSRKVARLAGSPSESRTENRSSQESSSVRPSRSRVRAPTSFTPRTRC